MDLSVAATPADDFVLTPAVRLTDNQTGFGINGSVNYIYDGAGVNVAESLIEKGQAGAARPKTSAW